MKTKRRIEISIETKQIAFLFNRAEQGLRVCPACNGKSVMISPSNLAEALDLSSREIYRLIEEGELHFFEDGRRRMTVCLRMFVERSSTQDSSPKKLQTSIFKAPD